MSEAPKAGHYLITNGITLTRLAGSVAAVASGADSMSVMIAMGAGGVATDILDGSYARAHDAESETGLLLDIGADHAWVMALLTMGYRNLMELMRLTESMGELGTVIEVVGLIAILGIVAYNGKESLRRRGQVFKVDPFA